MREVDIYKALAGFKTQPCPTCGGSGAVAHRCTCGTLPKNTAYTRCESCYRVVDWRDCPTCRGKGTITINTK